MDGTTFVPHPYLGQVVQGDMVVEGVVESTVCPQCRVEWEEKKILQALSVLWSSSISDEADSNTNRSLLG